MSSGQVPDLDRSTRIMNIVVGVIFGGAIIGGALLLGAYNESHFAALAGSQARALQMIKTVNSSAVNPANEGQFIHLTGTLETDGEVTAPEYGVTLSDVWAIKGEVTMFQWLEQRKRVGRGSTAKTVSVWSKGWSKRHVTSQEATRSKHINPAEPMKRKKSFLGKNPHVGAFSLTPPQLRTLTRVCSPLPVPVAEIKKIPEGGKLEGNKIFFREGTVKVPYIGDSRVQLFMYKPVKVSIYGKQVGNGIQEFKDADGNGFLKFKKGIASAATMLDDGQQKKGTPWVGRTFCIMLIIGGAAVMMNALAHFSHLQGPSPVS